MNPNAKIEEKIILLMERDYPRPPIIKELGGDYYYECHWLTCKRSINKYMDFCPACGQRIDWKLINERGL